MSSPFSNFLPVVAACSLAALSACTGGDIGDGLEMVEIGSEKALSADDADAVDVENPYGGVVVTGESGRAEYVIRPTAGSGVDAADLDEVEVTARIDGSTLKVTVSGPTGLTGAVDVEVLAPTEQAFVILAGDDDVNIDGLEGTGVIDSESGNISIAGFMGGELVINTQDGAVDVGVDDASDAAVVINTSSGDIDFTIPTDADFEFAANSTSGSVDIDASGFDGTAFGGVAAGTFGAGSGSVVLNSNSGTISVSN